MGTKDYRKPEWVTHMEEMQKALKGMYSFRIYMKLMKIYLANVYNIQQLHKYIFIFFNYFI